MRIIGVVLVLLGILLPMVKVPLPSPFAILVVDTTAPVAVVTTPASGMTYSSLTVVSAQVKDLESGVVSVIWILDSDTGVELTRTSGTTYDGVWSLTISQPSPGSHSFRFNARNAAGLAQTIASGTFTAYVDFLGNWYVNGIRITSPSQTIYSTSTAVSFQFVKTSGIADSSITCTISWGPPPGSGSASSSGSITLSNTAPSTWTRSNTFAVGQYDLTMDAYDGTKHLLMNLYGMQVGESFLTPSLPQWQELLNFVTLAGVVLVALSFFVGRDEIA